MTQYYDFPPIMPGPWYKYADRPIYTPARQNPDPFRPYVPAVRQDPAPYYPHAGHVCTPATCNAFIVHHEHGTLTWATPPPLPQCPLPSFHNVQWNAVTGPSGVNQVYNAVAKGKHQPVFTPNASTPYPYNTPWLWAGWY
ncbi:hypothetical protein D9758_010784 [Tetrapyrgos nigripes]|uniref:Uncharacterized protein n=1 Tax=Tetrapyrgos nigripes TaxID=182062 RepID=A0A8H5D765_9AGAR|nr:hypothetical protein D9758_010784 [Tetrapyrgos nigripes]